MKGEWDSANKAGDTQRADRAAQAAQAYYAQLRNNNYGSVADELASKDFEQSKYVKDYYAKTGNTEFRPYMYSLGSKYGLSQVDVDKLIKWDDTTSEITFAGKKLGKPSAVADGSSYFQDTSMLDNAFKEYAERTGLTRPASAMVSQENESLFRKYSDEYDYLKSTNPFETEVGRSILARYDLKGLQGRDSEVASGASTNAGKRRCGSAYTRTQKMRTIGTPAALTCYLYTRPAAPTALTCRPAAGTLSGLRQIGALSLTTRAGAGCGGRAPLTTKFIIISLWYRAAWMRMSWPP